MCIRNLQTGQNLDKNKSWFSSKSRKSKWCFVSQWTWNNMFLKLTRYLNTTGIDVFVNFFFWRHKEELIAPKMGSITQLMYINKQAWNLRNYQSILPELISQLLEPIQKPELTGDTFTKPNMSFCSLKPHSVTFDKEASIWLRE